MGSATRESAAEARATLASGTVPISLEFANELFAVADAFSAVPQLRARLADPATDGAEKAALARRVFGGTFDAAVVDFVISLTQARWSSPRQLTNGIRDLAVDTIARVANERGALDAVTRQLFTASRVFAENRDLQLAIPTVRPGTKAGELVDDLFASKVEPEALALIRYAATHNRGGTIAGALADFVAIAAETDGRELALVTTAHPLTTAQQEKMVSGLEAEFGRPLYAAYIVDKDVLGGVRAEIGSQVIDATTRTRLSDLRTALTK